MTIINTKLDNVYRTQTTLKPPESSLRRTERELPEFYKNQLRAIPTPPIQPTGDDPNLGKRLDVYA